MTDNALTKNRSRTPKMRTIPQAYKELKAADPNSAISLKGLRKMVSNGDIPSVFVQSKNLINVDLLFEHLSCYNQSAIQA